VIVVEEDITLDLTDLDIVQKLTDLDLDETMLEE
jgi:hypothetical protein